MHDKLRFLAAGAAVAFAVLLMFLEQGFHHALLESMTLLIERLNAEVVIVNRAKYSVTVAAPFARHLLIQARALPEVADVYPLYIELQSGLWKDTATRDANLPHIHAIRVLAFDPAKPVLRVPGLDDEALLNLQLPGTVLMDSRSRSVYGPTAGDIQRELAEKSIEVVGSFQLGPDFVNDGNLIMSDSTYARLFPMPQPWRSALDQVEIGLIHLREGADPTRVRDALRAMLPREEVAVLTRTELAQQEQQFWNESTPVGYVFRLGMFLGFLVGVIICGQILAADVADHHAEYATLKAIGYPDSYLTWVVLQAAILLSICGFIPGLLMSAAGYELLAAWTSLPMHLTVARAATVLGWTLVMGGLSGMGAMRKIYVTDPAKVFR
jgi:putative ABC transport system permease protein